MRPLLLFVLLILLPLPGLAGESPRQLTVQGAARVEVPADRARLTVTVTTTAPTAEAALEANSETLRKVETALREAGLESEEYRTSRFQIRPEWTPRPAQPPAGWRPTISGYTASNGLLITTTRLPQVGPFIEVATRAGADGIDNLSFDLADPAAARTTAISRATATARGEAEALARAAGVGLGELLSAQLDSAEGAPRPLMMRVAESTAPPLAPGNVSVPATVTLVYRIVPGDR